jgi:hypothetical protein
MSKTFHKGHNETELHTMWFVLLTTARTFEENVNKEFDDIVMTFSRELIRS